MITKHDTNKWIVKCEWLVIKMMNKIMTKCDNNWFKVWWRISMEMDVKKSYFDDRTIEGKCP